MPMGPGNGGGGSFRSVTGFDLIPLSLVSSLEYPPLSFEWFIKTSLLGFLHTNLSWLAKEDKVQHPPAIQQSVHTWGSVHLLQTWPWRHLSLPSWAPYLYVKRHQVLTGSPAVDRTFPLSLPPTFSHSQLCDPFPLWSSLFPSASLRRFTSFECPLPDILLVSQERLRSMHVCKSPFSTQISICTSFVLKIAILCCFIPNRVVICV